MLIGMYGPKALAFAERVYELRQLCHSHIVGLFLPRKLPVYPSPLGSRL